MQVNPIPRLSLARPPTASRLIRPYRRERVVLTSILGHVLALRLYTTNAYRSLNDPLRNKEREGAHPFPVSTMS